MKKIILTIFILITGLGIFFPYSRVGLAYKIETLPNTPVNGDFVVGPGKTEILMSPGENATKNLLITNRTGDELNFKIEIEDFKGSKDPEESIVLLGDSKGPYSLKEYLHPELTEFSLKHGERLILPVAISIPQDAAPGGLYGAVLITTNPPEPKTEAEIEKAKGQVRIITRLGALFFIRIKGEVKEEGALKEFNTLKKFYENGPITFKLFFENTGSVYLNPYGKIEIFNLLNKKVGELDIDSYFVLPDAVKLREIKWDKKSLFGSYTAKVSLNRGYQNLVDTKTITFWVLPWKIILAILAIIFVIIWLIRWILSNFEIRRKK